MKFNDDCIRVVSTPCAHIKSSKKGLRDGEPFRASKEGWEVALDDFLYAAEPIKAQRLSALSYNE